MKKKWIAAFIAAGVLLFGGVTVYAVKTSSQSTVKVVSVSNMSGGGGWSDNSLSGNITSDVSQNIYLADSQTVKKIYVKEGDTVKVGDDLLTYDMTLENLDLEMKKLEKQAPIRVSSSAYLKRFSKMLSVTMLVPVARASVTAICGCISVGYPGYGKVFTCVLRSFFAEITRTASSNSSTSHPISSNLAVIASRCFGITFLIRISPRVAAAANI